jgi:hypothetical protein
MIQSSQVWSGLELYKISFRVDTFSASPSFPGVWRKPAVWRFYLEILLKMSCDLLQFGAS